MARRLHGATRPRLLSMRARIAAVGLPRPRQYWRRTCQHNGLPLGGFPVAETISARRLLVAASPAASAVPNTVADPHTAAAPPANAAAATGAMATLERELAAAKHRTKEQEALLRAARRHTERNTRTAFKRGVQSERAISKTSQKAKRKGKKAAKAAERAARRGKAARVPAAPASAPPPGKGGKGRGKGHSSQPFGRGHGPPPPPPPTPPPPAAGKGRGKGKGKGKGGCAGRYH